ncbi:MAG: 1-(5-phosphoribosyl)-5-[(5-phosphoribosylamino)methylideneamino]imidazole-4-carboxamide isomerase [Nitrospirae bacterium]|uniref:1-(5-phosphoribosyl)-5-[(5- phosphoribosylamino)methylideneamino]imidazole-4- carboxamide isomerase n=1 Tax=Candidatus Magnetobacterium casense TaxID=1455061 RepID=UPI00058C45BE|nr:1-(5-phosphoribosyl)-5-[(5-phosphoribosylamino)methylideneamino]imidazole-4-carboxamide isomerase [Candidatus Magnetobacterium casensis]MBF0336425.1 1-(5-phosphoribosyl)-5-[(5-phosphoribosylamino)methylideneamino]imidazole-4-carboxamide isomerase [Nitrospirota bacterium]
MLIIPAIDLKDGVCVRLQQGRKDAVTVYSDDPAATALAWVRDGAELIHIVDLDGAFTGDQLNIEGIKRIRAAVDVPLEVGGGIRDEGRLELMVSLGIDRLIIGTAAITQPEMFQRACQRYPGRILAGIDADNSKVAIKGWQEVTQRDAIEVATELQGFGAAGVIYTDISRDGMLSGPNVEATQQLANALNIPVIASGGVSSLEDIKNLSTIAGLYGIITGKAIYSGAIALKAAIELVRQMQG